MQKPTHTEKLSRKNTSFEAEKLETLDTGGPLQRSSTKGP